jgi:hypothetical protein
VADGLTPLRAGRRHKRKGRGLGAGTPNPTPIQRKQVAREVRTVIAEDIEDYAYRALIRLARIDGLDSRDPVAFSRSCDSPNFWLAEAEFVLGSCDSVWLRAVVQRGEGGALRPLPWAEQQPWGVPP